LADTPTTPPLAQYTYILCLPTLTGRIELCVIFQPCGFGVCQTTLPEAKSTPISSAVPPGARIARSPSISGHCPAYHSGTVAPN
jgi:hypothetical protein